MSTDFLERLEEPEHTGDDRCWPCTAVNLLIAAGLAALVGRRSRALGLLTFLGSAALVYLRGYLVPGTPGLTKRYLPESVLAAFGKADRPAEMDASLTEHAADRASDDGAATVEVTAPDRASDDVDDERGDADEENDDVDDVTADADADDDVLADTDDEASADVSREDVEALLARPMDQVLEAFEVVEEVDGDLVLVDSFREAWEREVDTLADDDEARREAFADLIEEPVSDVEIERRDDDRLYGLLEGTAANNWMTGPALYSDLAAHRALSDPRWDLLEPTERLSVLRGFRVFLTTCPDCGGPVSATDDAVESCCGTWEVIAVECGDCGARILELDPPEEGSGPAAGTADQKTGGFTR